MLKEICHRISKSSVWQQMETEEEWNNICSVFVSHWYNGWTNALCFQRWEHEGLHLLKLFHAKLELHLLVLMFCFLTPAGWRSMHRDHFSKLPERILTMNLNNNVNLRSLQMQCSGCFLHYLLKFWLSVATSCILSADSERSLKVLFLLWPSEVILHFKKQFCEHFRLINIGKCYTEP